MVVDGDDREHCPVYSRIGPFGNSLLSGVVLKGDLGGGRVVALHGGHVIGHTISRALPGIGVGVEVQCGSGDGIPAEFPDLVEVRTARLHGRLERRVVG